jgi:hypothetical protein
LPDGSKFTASASVAGTFALVYPKSVTVTLGVATPGYSGWTVKNTFGGDIDGLRRVAIPDNVSVTGRLTSNGIGVMGVEVAFIPDSFLLDAVYVETGPGGYYTASVPAGSYVITVEDNTTLLGGEKYMYEESLTLAPTGVTVNADIEAVKRVEISGLVTGSSGQVTIKLSGPEEKTITTVSGLYSDFVLAGAYKVYVTATSGINRYANLSLIDVSYSSRSFDFQLLSAQPFSGTVTINGDAPGKQITVTAVASTGEAVTAKSTSQGQYSLSLPAGAYSVSYLLEDLLDEEGNLLFVEYFADELVTIADEAVLVSPDLEMRLDNSTFSGTVLGLDGTPIQARVSLIATAVYGMDSSFTTSADGSFSVQVQPGDYSVYVTRTQERAVNLTSAHFTRNEPSAMQLSLRAGSFVTGTSTMGGSAAGFEMSLSLGNAKMQIVSDSSGHFETLLPPGIYTLSAFTTEMENGTSVSYSSSKSVTVVESDLYVTFDLVRDTKRSLSTSWDRNLTQTAAPGVAVEYAFTVKNTGNIDDTYLVTFTGTGFDVSFSPSEFSLAYFEDNVTTVVAKVSAKNTTVAGDAKVACLVRSKTLSSVRSEVSLYLNVGVVRGLNVTSLNESDAVYSTSSTTNFQVNNTGNAPDVVMLKIANLEALAAQGWSAEILDSATGDPVDNVTLAAFSGEELLVNFSAIRSDPDPTAEALIYAYSKNATGVGAYGPVPVQLPDVVMGPGYVDATRDDVTYGTDVMDLYMDIGLLIALAALVVTLFLLRRKKGLGRSAKK